MRDCPRVLARARVAQAQRAKSGAEARSYAELELHIQALMCLRKAVEREQAENAAADEAIEPRTDIDALYAEYQAALKTQMDEANAAKN